MSRVFVDFPVPETELAGVAPGQALSGRAGAYAGRTFDGTVATVSVRLDAGSRSATVTADGELACQGITLWDFQPLVQRNPTMAWTLLQTLAGMLRQAGEAPNQH